MTNPLTQALEAIEKRLASPNIAVIERHDKLTGEHIVYSPDLEQMADDIRKLLATLKKCVEQRDAWINADESKFHTSRLEGMYNAELAAILGCAEEGE